MTPEGWKLVPAEPTEDMLAATSWPGCARADYLHMLDAAPTPPVVQQDDEALEVLRLALDALVWEVGSEPALCAGQTRRAIERARALLAKRGEK